MAERNIYGVRIDTEAAWVGGGRVDPWKWRDELTPYRRPVNRHEIQLPEEVRDVAGKVAVEPLAEITPTEVPPSTTLAEDILGGPVTKA